MKILIVSMAFPLPLKAGGRIRIFNQLKHLSEQHDVDFISLYDSEVELQYLQELSNYCRVLRLFRHRGGVLSTLFRLVRGIPKYLTGMPLTVLNKYSPALTSYLEQLLTDTNYDRIQIEWIQMVEHLSPSCRNLMKSKGILVEHDVAFVALNQRSEMVRGAKKWFLSQEASRMERYEEKWTQQFARIVVLSEKDRQMVSRWIEPERVWLLPQGIDLPFYQERIAEREKDAILMTGWYRHFPNRDGLQYALREIFPRILQKIPKARLYVVGENPPRIALPSEVSRQVIFTGFVQDIRSYFQRAAVLLVPNRIEGGMVTKILEAMGSGTPVVCTSTAGKGIEAVPGVDLLVGDDPETIAHHVIHLLQEKKRQQQLSQVAYRTVREKYTWSRVFKEQERMYYEMMV